MSEDKKLVEVWQSEFESLMAETFSHRSLEKENGHYIDRDVFYWFTGFLMAKRSHPSVVLPKEIQSIVMPSVFNAEDIYAAITAAGIKYTIGE